LLFITDTVIVFVYDEEKLYILRRHALQQEDGSKALGYLRLEDEFAGQLGRQSLSRPGNGLSSSIPRLGNSTLAAITIYVLSDKSISGNFRLLKNHP